MWKNFDTKEFTGEEYRKEGIVGNGACKLFCVNGKS
jgi:hypothetical protein